MKTTVKLSVIGRFAIFFFNPAFKVGSWIWAIFYFLPTALCQLPTDREPSNPSNLLILYPIRHLRLTLTLLGPLFQV